MNANILISAMIPAVPMRIIYATPGWYEDEATAAGCVWTSVNGWSLLPHVSFDNDREYGLVGLPVFKYKNHSLYVEWTGNCYRFETGTRNNSDGTLISVNSVGWLNYINGPKLLGRRLANLFLNNKCAIDDKNRDVNINNCGRHRHSICWLRFWIGTVTTIPNR